MENKLLKRDLEFLEDSNPVDLVTMNFFTLAELELIKKQMLSILQSRLLQAA